MMCYPWLFHIDTASPLYRQLDDSLKHLLNKGLIGHTDCYIILVFIDELILFHYCINKH
jgi:hypothetical protein